MENPFGQFRSAVLPVFPSNFLPTPSLVVERGKSQKKRKPWWSASTAQQ